MPSGAKAGIHHDGFLLTTMKKSLLLLLLAAFTAPGFAQQLTGYQFTVRVKGLENSEVMLGHHYGNKQYVIDTVQVDDKGEVVFAGNDTLVGGIYLVVIPKMKNKYFEMVVSGQESKFTMETDTFDLVGHMRITGSKENELFYKDMRFIAAKKDELNTLKTKLTAVGDTTADGLLIKEEMKKLNAEVESTRASYIQDNPNLFYAKFLQAVTDIKIPEAPVLADGTIDSTFRLKYVRAHFFDNIDFTDERLLRTNLYDARIKKYLNDYIYKVPDSINPAVDFILEKAAVNKKTFQFITVMLLNDYATSKIMGYDAVYVYIVDKYYSTGKAFWLDDVGLYRIQAQAESVRPTLLGKTGQPLMLQDRNDNDIPLYSVQSKFTVIIFWSPDCGHCKKEMPKVEKLYPEIKALGGEIYAVYAETEFDKWEKWLDEHPVPWINVTDKKGKEMIEVKYHVDITPLIYVLDEHKKIIGKKLSIEQVPELLQNELAIEAATKGK